MINEEVAKEASEPVMHAAQKPVMLAIDYTGELSAKAIIKAMTLPVKAITNKIKNPHGKMSVKQLLRKDAGAQAIDMTEAGLGDFKKVAKKYGVDFAVVKHGDTDPPQYTIFFKAKDQDAIENVYRDYLNLQKQPKKESVRKKLHQKVKEAIGKVIKPRQRQHHQEETL